MEKTEITIDKRVFYTGDMANEEGWGTITSNTNDEWGLRFTVTMDDERIFRGLYLSMFEKSIGQRFKLDEQMKQEKAERLKRFKSLYGKKDKGVL